jgi:hypothetical protein
VAFGHHVLLQGRRLPAGLADPGSRRHDRSADQCRGPERSRARLRPRRCRAGCRFGAGPIRRLPGTAGPHLSGPPLSDQHPRLGIARRLSDSPGPAGLPGRPAAAASGPARPWPVCVRRSPRYPVDPGRARLRPSGRRRCPGRSDRWRLHRRPRSRVIGTVPYGDSLIGKTWDEAASRVGGPPGDR